MKTHTQSFKNNVKEMGRELNSKITYSLAGKEMELGNSELNSVTPVFESALLKSVMKELDIDSNVDIPIGTGINYKLGVSLNGSPYEYIDFGNYIVYSSEKQEDTNSYNIVCYDNMLVSMKEYESLKSAEILGKSFPMTIRDYITCVCADLGLLFKNRNETFANYNKMIDNDLYADLGYTYRDIFDELAQVTASNIVVNGSGVGEVEIRYINETNDTIDEEYLKDVNVAFGEKYGPINSIVLSRAAGSDRIYLQNEKSVADNGLCEINISENQIMNFNNRDEFLPDILDKLDGLAYYTNDFSSTGVCYYDVCDKYNVQIGEEIYPCVMFNDQINVEQGLEEIIYTDLPEQAETDYSKADKTDKRINRTYLIVDKQNQTIEGMVEKVDDNIKQVTQLVADVEGLKSEVSKEIDYFEQSIEVFRVDMDSNVIIVSVNTSNYPIQNGSYTINFNSYFKNNKVSVVPTVNGSYTGITTSVNGTGITFTVKTTTQIPVLDNAYTLTFRYVDISDDDKEYIITKKIIVSLVQSGKDGTNGKDGSPGSPGAPGKDGKDAAIQSATPPEDKTQMWLDTTTNQLKRWNGEEWEVVNDFSDELDSISDTVNNLDKNVQQQLSDINGIIEEVRQTMSTQYEQTNTAFNFQFNTLIERITQLQDSVQTDQEETIKYIRFEDGIIKIGIVNNDFELQIKNDEIDMMYKGQRYSWWKQDSFYTNRLRLGNFAFMPRDNGSLDFGKVEE